VQWFRRAVEEPLPPSTPEPAPPGPMVDEVDRFINRTAGRLPGWAVVRSRWITDTLRAILEASTQEVGTVVLVTGMAGDYLPTTLARFAAIDEELRARPHRSGKSPEDHLRGQLDELLEAATAALAAVRDHDGDALATQSNFLRTKFTRSDLDLP
jgi:hypothetical protein